MSLVMPADTEAEVTARPRRARPPAYPQRRMRRGAAQTRPVLEYDSRAWLDALNGPPAVRDAAIAELHALLVRGARHELARRRHTLTHLGAEDLSDLVTQAADDALVAILAKLDTFRGASRFTTWAYKFVIFEVSAKLGRHFWRRPAATLGAEAWERLPDRFGFEPAQQSEWRDLLAALHRAVDQELTPRQRKVFVAIVVNEVPLDALVAQLGSNRNAIYKVMFDARRKLKAALAANGYLGPESSRRS
jgi:RNA polymerase sigma-70 factor (ECF subfamily)